MTERHLFDTSSLVGWGVSWQTPNLALRRSMVVSFTERLRANSFMNVFLIGQLEKPKQEFNIGTPTTQ